MSKACGRVVASVGRRVQASLGRSCVNGGTDGHDRWYVLHSPPIRETRVVSQLNFPGFRSFLPMYWKTIRHARRFRTIKAPFFPRYLFVSLDLQRARWRSVNGTYGVSGLLMG